MYIKVEEFKKLNDATLDALCDCVKPAFYIERTHIVREGYPIDEMLFVVQGKQWTYTSKGRTTRLETSNHCRDYDIIPSKKDHLEDGDFCGEELVAWAMDDPSSSNLPVSTRTIQALTKVEAFALMADDLKKVFIKHQLSSTPALNFDHVLKAVRVIQDAWRRYQSRRNSTRSTGEMDSDLRLILSQGVSFLNALQSVRSPERMPPSLPLPRAEHEIIVEEP